MTADSLEEVLGRLLDRLPRVLADGPARAAAMQVAARLPGALAGGPLGLELRLAGPHRIDLFAAATPDAQSFGELIAALRQPARPWSDPVRAADLGRSLARWQARTGPLSQVARYLLVEADAPVGQADPPVPSIFLAPRANRDRFRQGQPPNAFQRFPEIATMAAAELAGIWPDPATAAALSQLIAALPEDADIFAIGAMAARPAGASLRVAIRRLPDDRVATVLRAGGYAAQAPVIARLARVAPVPDRVIAFDVGPGAEDRVGLELSPAADWKLASTAGWAELLDYAAGLGVADRDRLDAVEGLVDATGDPLWGLAHVKVAASSAGVLPVAKLYVGVLHREGPEAQGHRVCSATSD